MGLRVEWKDAVDDLAALTPEWTALISSDPQATPFQTPEWIQLWHRFLAPRSRLRLLTLRDGKDLVAIYPLAQVRGLWSVLRPAGVGPSDYLSPVQLPGVADVPETLAHVLTESTETDLLDLHQLRANSSMAAELNSIEGRSASVQSECLRISLPASFETYVQGLSKSLRYDVRRAEKLDPSRYRFEDTDSPDHFFYLHAQRWRKRGLPGAFMGRLIPFHRAWCETAAKHRWLRMSTLWDGDEPIGALYGMALGGQTFFYQSGFAPAKGAVSPGTLLISRTIRRTIEEGGHTFDLMRGAEDYKRRWKPTEEEANLRFVKPLTSLGKSAERWTRRAMSVENQVRQRFEGRGLFA